MTQKHAERIVAQLAKDGIEAQVYKRYSGRFMFGETTTGVVSHSVEDIKSAARQCRIASSKFRQDNMARDMIVY